MRSTVGISLLLAQAVAEGQGGGGCQVIVADPLVGETKRGDLAGVYAYDYKFKSQTQLVFIAMSSIPRHAICSY